MAHSLTRSRPIASSIIHAACMLAARAHKRQLKTRLAYVVGSSVGLRNGRWNKPPCMVLFDRSSSYTLWHEFNTPCAVMLSDALVFSRQRLQCVLVVFASQILPGSFIWWQLGKVVAAHGRADLPVELGSSFVGHCHWRRSTCVPEIEPLDFLVVGRVTAGWWSGICHWEPVVVSGCLEAKFSVARIKQIWRKSGGVVDAHDTLWDTRMHCFKFEAEG